jgi:hypothetical protein
MTALFAHSGRSQKCDGSSSTCKSSDDALFPGVCRSQEIPVGTYVKYLEKGPVKMALSGPNAE